MEGQRRRDEEGVKIGGGKERQRRRVKEIRKGGGDLKDGERKR